MTYSKFQLTGLVLLRLTIGWHFLYEGVIKFYNPYWSAKGYLLSAEGVFKPLFTWLSGDGMIGIVNGANITLTLAVGLTLMLGLFTRIGAVIGCLLLLMFYLAHPPLHGFAASTMGGTYWIVNYNLVEIAGLLVIIAFPTSRYFGLENLIKGEKK
jgi:thiosulfate dehydrogenase [quinone] large subunit